MPQIIEVPGIGHVEFPDGMSDEQITAAIRRNMPPTEAQKNISNGANITPTPSSSSLASVNASDSSRGIGKQMFDQLQVGAGSGFTKVGEGLKGAFLQAKEALGMAPQGTYNQYQKDVDAEHALYNNTPIGKSTVGQTADIAAQTLPYLLPVGNVAGVAKTGIAAAEAAPKILSAIGKSMAKNAAVGAGINSLQYVPEAGSRAANTALGAITGAVLPPAILGLTAKNPFVKYGTGATLGVIGNNLFGDGSLKGDTVGAAAGLAMPFVPGAAMRILSKDAQRSPIQDAAAMNMLTGINNPEQALLAQQAANRLDPRFSLTPAEASGNPIAAAAQGARGTSKPGAQMLYNFGNNRQQVQKDIINNFLSNISPNNSVAAEAVRSAAKSRIASYDRALSAAAKPLYDEAYKVELPGDQFNTLAQDPVIQKSIGNVMNDPVYQRDIAGSSPNSIRVLDLAKRNIDDQISAAKRAGEGNRARLLMGAKESLTSVMDNASPTYASARALYGEGAKPVEQLRNSNLGRLADLPDMQLKNVSKIIFDPSQTDPAVLIKLRDEISRQNPDAWNSIVRNEMERRLNKIDDNDYAGTNFYNKILKNDRDFNQFKIATNSIPGATQKLNDMRVAFKNLIEPVTPKTAARLAKSSLDVPRSTSEAVLNHLQNIMGGQYDQAAIKLITSNNWDKEFAQIKSISSPSVKAQKYADLLSRISGLGAVNLLNNGGQ